MEFIDQHRHAHGVEPICKVLQIAPSGYWRHAALRLEPYRRCTRAIRDEALIPQIERVWNANMQVYGADNALAETINGLYKAELIHRRAPWKTKEAVELATLEWVSWFNHQRLLEPIGYIPPAEAEANYYRQLASQTTTVEV